MSDDRKTPEGRLDRSPIHLLHRLEQYAGDVFQEEMKQAGLTPRQYAVLLTVAQNEGLSQTGLVERTGIDRSTLADIIRRMLRKGLLTRRRTKEDARAYSVRLTPKGRESLMSATPAALNADNRLLKALPPAKRQEFLENLIMLVSNIDSLEQNKNN